MLNATQVEAFFDAYLQSKVRKGALLISGDWGSGKTHLALTRLKPSAEKAGYKAVYLTIADVENQDGFERSLLIASYGVIGPGRKKIWGASLGVADKWLSNHGTSLGELASFRNALSASHLLFVDDLERASEDLRKRVLYRLANLAETTGVKVVILADEKQIAKGDDKSYGTIKEKAVGKTIEFQPSFEELAATAVEVVYSAAPKNSANGKWRIEHLIDHAGFLEISTTVLQHANCRNLRTAIAATIDSCELTEQVLKGGKHLSADEIQSLVHTSFVLVVETRNSKDNLIPLRKYASSGTELPWMHFMSSSDPSKSYLTEFESKYVDGTKIRFLRSTAILNFVEKGAYDEPAIYADLAILSPKDDAAPAFKRIGKYQSISKSEFDSLAHAAMVEVNELKIRSLHLMAESAQTLFFLSRKGLFPLSPSELKINFSDALERLASEYRNGMTDISLGYDQSLLWSQPDVDLKSVLEHIQDTANKLETTEFSRVKTLELSRLASDPAAFINSLVASESPIATRECLNADDALQIFNILKDVIETNEIPQHIFHRVERAIAHRFLGRGLGRSFKQEIAFLEYLSSEIPLLTAPPENSLLKDAIETLSKTLKDSIEVLHKG